VCTPALMEAVSAAETAKVTQVEAEQVAADTAIERAEATLIEARAQLETDDSQVVALRQALCDRLAAVQAALALLPPADGPSWSPIPRWRLSFVRPPQRGLGSPSPT